jgi:predicted dehydrogenase
MIDTAKKNNKRLMIGQCLRFWGEYAVAKQFIENGELGKPVAARFYRGGSSPSKDSWYFERHKGGGALFDQHIHDIDMVNYLFGLPKAVSSIGCNAVPGSGYDIVSTNYLYDGMSITTQDDWMGHKYAFGMEFHINFEKGTIILNDDGFKVYHAKKKDITPEFKSGEGYYNEIKYFTNSILNNTENTINPPESSMNTIKIALAETKSCDKKGEIVTL